MTSPAPSLPSTSQVNAAPNRPKRRRSAAAKARRREQREERVLRKRLCQSFSTDNLHTRSDLNGRIRRITRRVRRLFSTGLQLSKQATLEKADEDSETRKASQKYLERAYRAAEHVLRLIEYRRRQQSKDNKATDQPEFSQQELVNYCHSLVFNKPL